MMSATAGKLKEHLGKVVRNVPSEALLTTLHAHLLEFLLLVVNKETVSKQKEVVFGFCAEGAVPVLQDDRLI